ncbi:hypothetical protein P3T76_008409 [Phytophthora citrophthora]|uniref:Uncharacterized protein n=1 Tax=Phytophthora citrophthora TaxID=4793 RepID=A0AAD9LKX2_9STRA|nr:hypothetical protein P3T76_008409 [Phytophthora citrophthora]
MSAALTDPSSRETRKFLDDIRNETTSVLNRLKRHRSVADQEVLTLIAVVKKLVDHTAYGWDARQDLTAQECVKELKNIVGKTSQWKPQHSEDLLRSIAKWNINDPPLT